MLRAYIPVPTGLVRVDVADCIAIRSDIAIKLPRVPESVVQVKRVCAHRHPVHSVVGAHDAYDVIIHRGKLHTSAYVRLLAAYPGGH